VTFVTQGRGMGVVLYTAKAHIKNLVYTSITMDNPIDFVPLSITFAKGNKIRTIIKPLSQYIISMNIKLLGVINAWINILRFTTNPTTDAANIYGSRNPTL